MATQIATCDYCGAHASHAAISTPDVHRPGCPVPARLRQADALIALVASAAAATASSEGPGACSGAGRD